MDKLVIAMYFLGRYNDTINFNINKIAKNINCFVLVAPTSVIYKDKTSIKQLCKACMFYFLPHPVPLSPSSMIW